MKRSLLICAAALMMLGNVPQADADDVVLTLDLSLNFRSAPDAGGQWALYARKVETGGGDQGDNGISGIRALINNIDAGSVTFASGTGTQLTCNGGPCIQTLSNGAVEIVYTQDLNGTVVTGVGVSATATQDRLIASGTYAGTRPSFANDGASPTPFRSEVNFLGGASAPFPASVLVNNVTEQVVILGDMNNSGTVTNLDIQPFINRLPPTPSLPYIPNGDIAGTPGVSAGTQSGTITNLDINPFITLLGRPNLPPAAVSAISVVPEPSSIGLALLASLGLVSRRRRG